MTEAKSVWSSFDCLAEKLVDREISFPEFVERASTDFSRMARVAARRRRLPAWMGLDDVRNEAIRLAWHYAFERVDRAGRVGFVKGMYRSAGAYLRFKVRNKLAKIISSARGENQHTRKGPPSPELLSKTGEVPEQSVDPSAESELASARQRAALEKLCRRVREFVVAREVVVVSGGDAKVAEFLLNEPKKDRAVAKDLAGSFRELGIQSDDDARRAVVALRSAGVLPKKRKVKDEHRRSDAPGEGLGIAS